MSALTDLKATATLSQVEREAEAEKSEWNELPLEEVKLRWDTAESMIAQSLEVVGRKYQDQNMSNYAQPRALLKGQVKVLFLCRERLKQIKNERCTFVGISVEYLKEQWPSTVLGAVAKVASVAAVLMPWLIKDSEDPEDNTKSTWISVTAGLAGGAHTVEEMIATRYANQKKRDDHIDQILNNRGIIEQVKAILKVLKDWDDFEAIRKDASKNASAERLRRYYENVRKLPKGFANTDKLNLAVQGVGLERIQSAGGEDARRLKRAMQAIEEPRGDGSGFSRMPGPGNSITGFGDTYEGCSGVFPPTHDTQSGVFSPVAGVGGAGDEKPHSPSTSSGDTAAVAVNGVNLDVGSDRSVPESPSDL